VNKKNMPFVALKIFPLLMVTFSLTFYAKAETKINNATDAKAGQKEEKDTVEFKPYSMDSNYFSCEIPSTWGLNREKDKDEEYRIYEIELIAPESDAASATVFVSYYAGDNEDFNGYTDFIERNSKNVFGETRNARENYEPVKKAVLGKRNVFELARECMRYLSPQSKSDASVQLKEKLYVLPAKDGFYVLHFTAPKTLFAKYLPVFERISRTFKGRP
jgi:hypothetical protein